jgi:hypothetical protein
MVVLVVRCACGIYELDNVAPNVNEDSGLAPSGTRTPAERPYICIWRCCAALVSKRNYRSAIQRILAPCLLLVLALLLDFSIRNDNANTDLYADVRTPERVDVLPIRNCKEDYFMKPACFDFIYSPVGDPAVEVRSTDTLPVSPCLSMQGRLFLFEASQAGAPGTRHGCHYQRTTKSRARVHCSRARDFTCR